MSKAGPPSESGFTFTCLSTVWHALKALRQTASRRYQNDEPPFDTSSVGSKRTRPDTPQASEKRRKRAMNSSPSKQRALDEAQAQFGGLVLGGGTPRSFKSTHTRITFTPDTKTASASYVRRPTPTRHRPSRSPSASPAHSRASSSRSYRPPIPPRPLGLAGLPPDPWVQPLPSRKNDEVGSILGDILGPSFKRTFQEEERKRQDAQKIAKLEAENARLKRELASLAHTTSQKSPKRSPFSRATVAAPPAPPPAPPPPPPPPPPPVGPPPKAWKPASYLTEARASLKATPTRPARPAPSSAMQGHMPALLGEIKTLRLRPTGASVTRTPKKSERKPSADSLQGVLQAAFRKFHAPHDATPVRSNSVSYKPAPEWSVEPKSLRALPKRAGLPYTSSAVSSHQRQPSWVGVERPSQVRAVDKGKAKENLFPLPSRPPASSSSHSAPNAHALDPSTSAGSRSTSSAAPPLPPPLAKKGSDSSLRLSLLRGRHESRQIPLPPIETMERPRTPQQVARLSRGAQGVENEQQPRSATLELFKDADALADAEWRTLHAGSTPFKAASAADRPGHKRRRSSTSSGAQHQGLSPKRSNRNLSLAKGAPADEPMPMQLDGDAGGFRSGSPVPRNRKITASSMELARVVSLSAVGSDGMEGLDVDEIGRMEGAGIAL